MLRIKAMRTLVLASIALMASVSVTHAQDYRIRFGDLDLSTAEGVASFDARLLRQARGACTVTGSRLPNSRCLRAFHEEALALLSERQRRDYARVRGETVSARTVTPPRSR
jgi:UrcA family protein